MFNIHTYECMSVRTYKHLNKLRNLHSYKTLAYLKCIYVCVYLYFFFIFKQFLLSFAIDFFLFYSSSVHFFLISLSQFSCCNIKYLNFN